MEAKILILEVQVASQARLCCCGCRATSKLSYAEDIADQENASPALSDTDTPLSSPVTDQSYQTPLVEQATVLVPVPEDVQLLSPNSSESEAIPILPPHAPTLGRQVSGQCCWTRRKPEPYSGTGAARLFQTSTRLQETHHS